MKKIFSFLVFAIVAKLTIAQPVKEIDKFVLLGRWAEAEAALKAYSTNPKTADKPVIWYYRGKLDLNASNDSSLAIPQAMVKKNSSFEAFKKYQMLDIKAESLAEENYRPYLMLYAGYYDLGAAAYNKKEYANSYQAFAKALETEEYIVGKGYKFDEIKFAAFDTSLIMNTALAAVQAKDTASSIMMYSRFLDRGIMGEGNKQVYEIVVDYYVRKRDVANANKYIKIAQENYPKDKDIWNEYAVKLIGKDNKELLYAQYDKMLAEDPTNFTLSYNYAVELYNSLYASGEKRPTDIIFAKKRLTELLTIAVASDKGIDAAMLMTNHLFNITAEYSLEENAEKVAAKKVERKKKTLEAANAVIPYAEKVIGHINNLSEPTVREKADKKNVLGYLMDIYFIKGDPKKAGEYEKLRTAVKI